MKELKEFLFKLSHTKAANFDQINDNYEKIKLVGGMETINEILDFIDTIK